MSWTDSVVRVVLPNGLTLLVQRDSSVPVVAVVTHVRAGYFDEPDRWTGIAHVLEHMYFKGAGQHGPGALARETQRLGGYLNASTTYDRTIYYAVVPAADGGLTRAVHLHAEALMDLTLDPDELARELEVIIQEAKRKLDTPSAVTVETLYELLFRVHRMRRWRIGTEAGLRALTAADVRSYYESRYTPDRVVVALTGNLDVDAALRLAQHVYGSWQRPVGLVEPSPAEPNGRTAVARLLRGDVERPLAAIGWRTVGPDDPDAPALDVAAGILGSGRASWLSTVVRGPGLASAVSASHYTPGDVGVFDLSLTMHPERVEPAIHTAVGLTEALAGHGPDPVQLARVRALFSTYWARRLESADARATLLAEYEAHGGYRRAEEYRVAIESVTADDVRRVAARWLSRDAACVTAYLSDAADGVAELAWPASEPVATPAPPPALPARPPVRDSGGNESWVGDVRVVRWPGTELLLRRRPGAGIVALSAYLPGLPGRETAANAGISRLLLRTALRGADGCSADALAAAAELLGGSIGTTANADMLGVTLTVHPGAVGGGIALLRAVLERPTLAADDVAREAGLQADDAARRRDDMFSHPIEGAIRAAFGGDPYGLHALGEPDVVRSLTPDALREWHTAVAGTRALVVAVGDLSLDALRDAGAGFASWPGTGQGGAAGTARWVAGREAEQRAKAQTALAMAFPAAAAGSDDRYAHAVLAAVLSGLAGRLFDELRERRALGYTVHASPWLRRRGGAVLAYIATSPEREDEARTAMLEVLGGVADGPLPEEELDRARAYAAGLVAIRRQHVRSVAGELADAWVQGRLERFGEEEDRCRAVSGADLRRIARAAFDPSRRAEYVVRGTGGSR